MSNSSTRFFVGLDLVDISHSACVLDEAGAILRRETVSNSREALLTFAASLPVPGEVTVGMECGTHSPWVSVALADAGMNVLVGNARRMRAVWDTDRKDDERDAEMFARLVRLDPRLMHPIIHRGKRAQTDLVVIKARDALVQSRTSLVNFVRGTLKATGVKLPKCSTEAFPKTVAGSIPEQLRVAINPVLETIAGLTCSIRRFDHQIEEMCREKYPETERLQQVKGVGPVTSLAFVLSLEDPNRFKKSRDVGPYLGLTPKRDQSGQSDKPLSITKAGNVYMRTLLVGAANYIMGPFGPDCDLRRYGERIAARGGKVAKRKAKVAVARKLAVLLHRLWVTEEIYEPFHRAAAKQRAA